MSKLCRICSQKNTDDAVFCVGCGYKFDVENLVTGDVGINSLNATEQKNEIDKSNQKAIENSQTINSIADDKLHSNLNVVNIQNLEVLKKNENTCKACGYNNANDAVFCVKCGAKLDFLGQIQNGYYNQDNFNQALNGNNVQSGFQPQPQNSNISQNNFNQPQNGFYNQNTQFANQPNNFANIANAINNQQNYLPNQPYNNTYVYHFQTEEEKVAYLKKMQEYSISNKAKTLLILSLVSVFISLILGLGALMAIPTMIISIYNYSKLKDKRFLPPFFISLACTVVSVIYFILFIILI